MAPAAVAQQLHLFLHNTFLYSLTYIPGSKAGVVVSPYIIFTCLHVYAVFILFFLFFLQLSSRLQVTFDFLPTSDPDSWKLLPFLLLLLGKNVFKFLWLVFSQWSMQRGKGVRVFLRACSFFLLNTSKERLGRKMAGKGRRRRAKQKCNWEHQHLLLLLGNSHKHHHHRSEKKWRRKLEFLTQIGVVVNYKPYS